MSASKFQSACVIGTGMMGPGIAVTLALGGVRATLLSRSDDGAGRGLESARTQLQVLEENGLAEPERIERARSLLAAERTSHDPIAAADLIIESAPEDLAFKQHLFAGLDAVARPGAVLASNTSGLSITAIASACRRPERVLTTHFWNPPHLVPLVEIVKGEKTDHALALAVRDLLEACGKVPVVVKKDRPGQLGNRLQMALVREAAYVIQEGIADAEDIDKAAMAGFGLRLPVYGVLEHMDAVGLNMVLGIQDYVTPDLCNQPHAPDYLRGLVQKGDLGAKTGRGFYDWSSKSLDEVKARRDAFLIEFLKSRFAKTPPKPADERHGG